MPDRNDELGGLWLKTSQRDGSKFMSGRLKLPEGEVEVVVFKNSHKQPGERTPDYRVYRSQPRDGAPTQASPHDNAWRDERGSARQNDAAARAQAPSLRPSGELDDDIPF